MHLTFQLYMSTICSVLLVIMLIMILRLYQLRKKNTYLVLATGLIVSLVYQAISISTVGSKLILDTAGFIMFMILNIGIYTHCT